MDPTALKDLFAAGPYGLCAILGLVVVFLWRANVAKDDKIEALNEKRADTAGRVESALTANKSAIEGLTAAVNQITAQVREGMDDLGSVQNQLTAVAQLVSGNGAVLSEMRQQLLSRLLERGGGR